MCFPKIVSVFRRLKARDGESSRGRGDVAAERSGLKENPSALTLPLDADTETMRFMDETGGEQVINKKDLVAVVPGPGGSSSTVIYVEHDEKDDTAPPRAKITKGGVQPTTQPPNTSDAETHIIISTKSGTNKAASFYEQAVNPVLEALFPEGHVNFLVHHTESTSTIEELTSDIFFPTANAGITLRIILLSGDGGIIDLVNGLLARPSSSEYKAPQVTLIPLGTANSLYHSTVAGHDNTWGLRALASNTAKPLPVFTTSFSSGARLLVDEARSEQQLPKDPKSQRPILHGAVVCSWAMHASLVADSDTTEYRKFGVERFKMAAKEALYPANGSPPHPYTAQISVLRGENWCTLEEQEHMYVLATMVSNLEKPFCISPATKPFDESLHLVHFGPTTGDEAMRIMGLAYQGGKHVDDPAVRYEAIDGLRIEFQGKEKESKWRRICVDGKIVKVEEDGWIELRKEQRRVLDLVIN
jgi:diacylglycerol kinase family enzyme